MSDLKCTFIILGVLWAVFNIPSVIWGTQVSYYDKFRIEQSCNKIYRLDIIFPGRLLGCWLAKEV